METKHRILIITLMTLVLSGMAQAWANPCKKMVKAYRAFMKEAAKSDSDEGVKDTLLSEARANMSQCLDDDDRKGTPQSLKDIKGGEAAMRALATARKSDQTCNNDKLNELYKKQKDAEAKWEPVNAQLKGMLESNKSLNCTRLNAVCESQQGLGRLVKKTREEVADRCFGGGDSDHRQQIDQIKENLKRRKKKCEKKLSDWKRRGLCSER